MKLLPKDAADNSSAIVEIRAGTGGDEAALFAADLLGMYQRYCQLQGWRTELMSITESDLGGIKDATLEVVGTGVLRQAEIRKRRASRAARAGDRGERAHPHLGRDRRRAARSRKTSTS